ncbi:hypothetical protein A1OS_22750, partial [Enterovibrio norvegicus]|uniref:HNH endonuclease n=1 Tax=Enterovibrio norvegicus TaxID=188144 RepID=UPI000584C08F
SCNPIAMIVMAVVAVVVTIYTAGAAAAMFASALNVAGTGVAGAATIGAAGAGVIGGATVAGSATLGIAAAAIGGAVGSAASQLVGKGLGVVDDFSWEQVALGGLASAATAGLGAAFDTNGLFNAAPGADLSWGHVGNTSFNSATSYGVNYLGSKALGEDVSFSWKSLAASVVGSVVSMGSARVTKGGIVGDTLTGFAGAATSSALRGDSFRDNAGMLLTDAFGNALANVATSGAREAYQTGLIESERQALNDLVHKYGIQLGQSASTNNGAVSASATEEQILAYIQAVRESGYTGDLVGKGGQILGPDKLALARSHNQHSQVWPGAGVAVIDDSDLLSALRERQSGLYSQDTSFLYQTDSSLPIEASMAAFVLNMGSYDDAGIVQGIQAILSGSEYIDISGIVENSLDANAANYTGSGLTPVNHRQELKALGEGPSLKHALYTTGDAFFGSLSAALDTKMPTFMQGEALFDVVGQLAGIGKLTKHIAPRDPSVLGSNGGNALGPNIVVDINPSKKIGGHKIINSDLAGTTVKTKGGDVRFDSDGFPDFTPYSQKTVRVEGLTGDMANDVPLAMERAGITTYDKTKYVWHHHQDAKSMMLVPKNVHSVRNGGVAHTGGRAVINHNLANPNNILNYASPEELF